MGDIREEMRHTGEYERRNAKGYDVGRKVRGRSCGGGAWEALMGAAAGASIRGGQFTDRAVHPCCQVH